MRIYAISDLHVDYRANAEWLDTISAEEFRTDVLLVAGDVSHSLDALARTLESLVRRFLRVVFVPGNHDLWVAHERNGMTSADKFTQIRRVVAESGALMETMRAGNVAVVPLLSWYDYSFGMPSARLREIWMDYYACRWPQFSGAQEIAAWFAAMEQPPQPAADETVITMSHFLPRRELVPTSIDGQMSMLGPVLGSAYLDQRVRALQSALHVFGHSHIRQRRRIDGVEYVSNPLGYPHERSFSAQRLLCVLDADSRTGG